MRRKAGRGNSLRTHIAQEAARLITESGIRDYALAKRKAAEQLQVTDLGQLPRNDEIEAALQQYQRLFRFDEQQQRLRHLRAVAVRAMEFLAPFEPHLVGTVLRGTADQFSVVSLHLFAEPPEEVGIFLLERGIPHELGERRVRFTIDDSRTYPVYRFMADETPIELVVFPHQDRWQRPLSPVDGKPMRRAGLAVVQDLATNATR